MNHSNTQTDQAVDPKNSPLVYRVLRYCPSLVRDEWVNIGVLVFHSQTGDHRFRLIQEEEEYRRMRRFHPRVDEKALRDLHDEFDDRFRASASISGEGTGGWQEFPTKLDNTLSNALQLSPQRAIVTPEDIETEFERLYADHIAVTPRSTRLGAPSSRARVRSYCSQVFRQARLWDRLEKSIRAERWTLPNDPFRIDYGYRRNGTLGFVHALSVSRSPGDFKQLAYTAERINSKEKLRTEIAAVTDVPLLPGDKGNHFVATALREVGIEPVPMEGFAVWVAKLKPLLLQGAG